MTRIGWCPGGRTVSTMLALYPGTTVVRVFVGPGDLLPAWDGPVLAPLVRAGAIVHLSYKTNGLAEVLAWAARKPAGVLLILTYAHEPEQGVGRGDPTVEQYRARWGELVAAFDAHPGRPEILLAPVYTRAWWQAHPDDPRWLLDLPVDVIGWDVYNNGLAYRSPDDLLTIPRQIAGRTGLPYLIAELGATRVTGDTTGAGRSRWMRDMVTAARVDGAVTACWYHKDQWDLATPGSEPEQATWRELIKEDPMPTYEQLQAEPWWGREITTPAMDWLGDELCRRTGRPRVAFGTKGDNHHLRGAHRSQEWIQRSVYCTDRTYTVQSGLTGEQPRHISGADFTPGEWGTPANRRLMVEQTGRLVAALKAGRLDGVREVIGTLDGRTVVGTKPDGSTFGSDDSHLDHWHLGIDRRRCDDQTLMERILGIALGDEDDMTPAQFADILRDPTVATLMRAIAWQYVGGGIPAGYSTLKVLAETHSTVRTLGEVIARESSSPDEVRALLAALPTPAPIDVNQLATAVAERVLAALPDGGLVSREDLEAALRSVLGSVDGATPAR